MKKLILKTSLFLAALLIIASSCTKNEYNGGDNTFTANINGRDIDAEIYSAEFDSYNNLYVSGTTGAGNKIMIKIGNFDGVKTYDFGGNNGGEAIYIPDVNYSYNHNQYTTKSNLGGGSLEVTSWNSTNNILNGTFHFKASIDANSYPDVDVTNGKLQNMRTGIKAETEDKAFFSVLIDGVYWESTDIGTAAIQPDEVPSFFIVNGLKYDFTFTILQPLSETSYNMEDLPKTLWIQYKGRYAESGTFNVTEIDTVNHYMKGTLDVVLYNEDGTPYSHLSNGQFSFKIH